MFSCSLHTPGRAKLPAQSRAGFQPAGSGGILPPGSRSRVPREDRLRTCLAYQGYLSEPVSHRRTPLQPGGLPESTGVGAPAQTPGKGVRRTWTPEAGGVPETVFPQEMPQVPRRLLLLFQDHLRLEALKAARTSMARSTSRKWSRVLAPLRGANSLRPLFRGSTLALRPPATFWQPSGLRDGGTQR